MHNASMSGSCHLDRALNVEIGIECQIFVIAIFFNCGLVLQFGALSLNSPSIYGSGTPCFEISEFRFELSKDAKSILSRGKSQWKLF